MTLQDSILLLRPPTMAICHRHNDATLNIVLGCNGVVADIDLLFTPPTFNIETIRWGQLIDPAEEES